VGEVWECGEEVWECGEEVWEYGEEVWVCGEVETAGGRSICSLFHEQSMIHDILQLYSSPQDDEDLQREGYTRDLYVR
jgi:hypothetical protein